MNNLAAIVSIVRAQTGNMGIQLSTSIGFSMADADEGVHFQILLFRTRRKLSLSRERQEEIPRGSEVFR